MVSETIFIKVQTPAMTLGEFAARVKLILSGCELLEHESSNYAEGHYFKGMLGSSEIELYYLDTEGLDQYPLAIALSSTQEGFASQVAENIARSGHPCFVPSGAWYRKSWSGEGVPMSSNLSVKRTAQRLRRWVPSALRAPAAAYLQR
jgi:hypothetical protein